MLDSNKIEYGARANKNDFCIDLFYKMKKSKFNNPNRQKRGIFFRSRIFSEVSIRISSWMLKRRNEKFIKSGLR